MPERSMVNFMHKDYKSYLKGKIDRLPFAAKWAQLH